MVPRDEKKAATARRHRAASSEKSERTKRQHTRAAGPRARVFPPSDIGEI